MNISNLKKLLKNTNTKKVFFNLMKNGHIAIAHKIAIELNLSSDFNNAYISFKG